MKQLQFPDGKMINACKYGRGGESEAALELTEEEQKIEGFIKVSMKHTRLIGTVARLPARVVGGMGSRVQSQAGFDSSINWGNYRKPSFLTLYCLSPNYWERLL